MNIFFSLHMSNFLMFYLKKIRHEQNNFRHEQIFNFVHVENNLKKIRHEQNFNQTIKLNP